VTAAPDGSTTYRPRHPVDPRFATAGAKSVSTAGGVSWWCTVTPHGQAAVAFRRSHDNSIRADAWGPGTDWALTALPTLLGADDHTAGDFDRSHPVIRRLARGFDSLRLGATGRWYEALAMVVIGQRVVAADARTSRTRLAHRFGEPGAGPRPAFPRPATLLGITDHDFHQAGIDRRRARVLRMAARHADRLERLDDLSEAAADRWLQRLAGVGPWTAAITTSIATGALDAVPVGDLHIARMVSQALCGEDGDDDRMLELLAPFAGHRQRVVRLITLAGPGPTPHRPAPTRADISGI